jgi:hypothetical protein
MEALSHGSKLKRLNHSTLCELWFPSRLCVKYQLCTQRREDKTEAQRKKAE